MLINCINETRIKQIHGSDNLYFIFLFSNRKRLDVLKKALSVLNITKAAVVYNSRKYSPVKDSKNSSIHYVVNLTVTGNSRYFRRNEYEIQAI